MSHPPQASCVTSPKFQSQNDRVVPPSSPTQNQSHVASLSKSPQAILNQKLIPRNYLSNGPKPSPTSTGIALNNAILNGLERSQVKPKQSHTSLSDQTRSGQTTPKPYPTQSLTRSGKGTPDSDVLGYEDLNVTRTRSSETSSQPVNPGRAMPDSPTIRSESHSSNPIMPRTSSIDSAISHVSNHSVPKVSGDVRSPSPNSVQALIAAAGGAENLIAHLLKDKSGTESQNAQLWKLVEKQRALLLGLNKDLDRVTKERDKYKKRLKESQPNAEGKNRRASQSPQKTAAHTAAGKTARRDGAVPDAHHELSDRGLGVRTPTHAGIMASELVGMPRPGFGSQQHSKRPSDPEYESHVQGKYAAQGTEPRSLAKINMDHEQAGQQPTFSLTIATPDKPGKTMNSSRKAPPKPLNLIRPNDALGAAVQDSAGSHTTTFDEEPERGRRRTREDDDRERALSALQAEEARSQSMKQEKPTKAARAASSGDEHKAIAAMPTSPPPGLPLSPRPQHAQTFLSQNQSQATASLSERMLAGALKSPGLPMSPRPMHNPVVPGVSLPLSPRANVSNPLSPRAPKQPLPVPTNPAAPVDPAALQSSHHKMTQQNPSITAHLEVDRLQFHKPATSEAPSVYRGLMAANYPNLLLPPNALPSIQVKVASSRAKPSRHSMLGFKVQEDSTIFSLSVISRSSNSELWRVDKPPSALPYLDQQLRPRCPELPKIPDRKLFSGQSPASADARKKAMDDYFEELLDVQIDEPAAVMICQFLSTDVIDPDLQDGHSPASVGNSPVNKHSKAAKSGYLTKKGKNFGGWKSRYFVLEGSDLRYFESPNGSHLGTIKLRNAQIGKPNREEAPGDDQDGQFRHAFLIQEPKRKDLTNYVRHVLCAESDMDRDEWVRALLEHANTATGDVSTKYDSESYAPSVNTVAREAVLSKEIHSASPTPTTGSSNADSFAYDVPAYDIPQRDHRAQTAAISGPINGGVIVDGSSWGNKQVQPQSSNRDLREKASKMGNLFGFKKDSPPATYEQKPPKPARILRHNGYIRPVFGLPLVEAVEFCGLFSGESDLPAVVYRCIEYLRYQNAAQEEGLFRLSGSNTTVRSLRERFNTEGDVDLVADEVYHDVHAVASLFKSYLRELPSTLLTRELHLDFMQVLELHSTAEKVAAFNVLVHRLPPANFALLKELSSFLLEVTLSSNKNKMSVRNMGIVFSPTLNIPTPVFTLFLTEFDAIFEGTDIQQTSSVRSTEVRAHALAPTDIRSPRHQMFSDIPTPAYHQTAFPGLPANPHDKDKAPHAGDPGDFGFVPVQPSYENGHYVSQIPSGRRQSAVPVDDSGTYSSLNGLLAPSGPPTSKVQRRESALIYSSIASK